MGPLADTGRSNTSYFGPLVFSVDVQTNVFILARDRRSRRDLIGSARVLASRQPITTSHQPNSSPTHPTK